MYKKIKVAMIGQKGIPATYGGVERHADEISRRLCALGCDVTVFCRNYYSRDEILRRALKKDSSGLYIYNDVRLNLGFSIPTKRLDAASHSITSTLKSLFNDYDIIHYHALGPTFFSPAAKLFGKKVFSTIHGLDYMRDKWGFFAKAFLRLGERVSAAIPNKTVVVSKSLQKFYLEKYNKKTFYIPNGIESPPPLSSQADESIRGKLGIEKGNYFLFVSRLVPEKGCATLIRAFKNVKTDMKLVIAGGDSHSGDYVARLKNEAIGDKRIIFAGYVYGEELNALYYNTAAFVLPSFLEGLPIVLLEAMIHGCTVIVSDIPENIEVVKPDESTGNEMGIIFKTGDESALENALCRFISGRASGAYLAMAAAGREHVRQTYSWDKAAEALFLLYKDACQNK